MLQICVKAYRKVTVFARITDEARVRLKRLQRTHQCFDLRDERLRYTCPSQEHLRNHSLRAVDRINSYRGGALMSDGFKSLRLAQVGLSEHRLEEHRLAYICTDGVCKAEVRSAEVRLDEARRVTYKCVLRAS